MIELPPELMSPEQRELRGQQLQRQISREWLTYAIVDGVVLAALTAVLVVGILTGSISDGAIVPVAIVGGALCGMLVTYWLLVRIRPLQNEVARLDAYDDRASARGGT